MPLKSDTPASRSEKYKVRVELNSITMPNDHDPAPKGKGEIENYAYIQGHRKSLVMHVDSGDTIPFDPPKTVTVYLDGNAPLSIFTVGIETDFCLVSHELEGQRTPPKYLTQLNPVFGNPQADWSNAISNVQSEIIKNYLSSGTCNWDKLGTIREFYDPINYQAGVHSVKSSSKDFTLRFTVTVTPVQP